MLWQIEPVNDQMFAAHLWRRHRTQTPNVPSKAFSNKGRRMTAKRSRRSAARSDNLPGQCLGRYRLLFAVDDHCDATKEKPPPFLVRVDQDKAPGGDLLQVAIDDRISNSKHKPNAPKTKASPMGEAFLDKAPGGDLLLHGRATLPSAHARFTSEFGMGSGGTTPLWPPGKGWEQREAPVPQLLEKSLHG